MSLRRHQSLSCPAAWNCFQEPPALPLKPWTNTTSRSGWAPARNRTHLSGSRRRRSVCVGIGDDDDKDASYRASRSGRGEARRSRGTVQGGTSIPLENLDPHQGLPVSLEV